MAFMMPVMKNNFDIYKPDTRSRKTSECSNASSAGGAGGAGGGAAPTLAPAMSATPGNGRRRRVGECKSESFSSSPSHAYRTQMQRCQSSRAFPRNSSRTSQSSTLSPTRSFYQASSPSKTTPATSAARSSSQSDLSKFHLRLVDKLRKSFRKDSAKRS